MYRRVEDLVVKERTIKMGLKLSEEQDQSTIQINQNSAHFEEDDTPSSGLDDLGSSSGSCEDEKLETDPREETAKEAGSSHLVPETTINSSGSSSCKAGGGTKLRRPEKPVPCPRCNSIDTKFCYFNNYNINQPRHFCKNCQRYWTAGGTLRNVPVGAGRRKSKHNSGSSSNSQQEHCTVLVEAGAQSSLKRNASPSPAVAEASNVFAAKTEIIPSGSIDNMQDGPCSSSEVTTECSGSTEGKTSTNPPPLPSSFPWPYGLPAAANNMPSNIPGEMAAWLNGVWAGMPPWAPLWGPSVWNTQWGAAAAAATFAAAAASNPFQKYSGKHSRGENASGGEGGRVDGCLWAPKTLRMDHPGEAAKSSIWATLGLDKAAPSSGGAFRSCRTAVIRQEVERREKDEDEEEEEVKLEEEKKQEEE